MDQSLPITVPDLGTGDETVRLSAWFVEPGESLAPGDSLFEILISGVTCSVAAQSAGRLARIDRALGSIVRPGDTVGWLESIGENI
ncbi:MAG: lipoyl domain-containing protein [Planctomycetales bacterium]